MNNRSIENAGPPASAKQISYLLALVEKAGHASFRDARRPLGLTQRQAGGKFTVQEASELIDRLLADPTAESFDGITEAATKRELAQELKRQEEQAAVVRGIPADVLADELRRRGWGVTEP